MGEIAEALRRAHAERAKGQQADRSKVGPSASPPEAEDVYSEATKRHQDEQHEDERVVHETTPSTAPPSPAAPAPAPRSDSPEASRAVPEDQTGVQLTHDHAEAHVPQGVLIDEGGAITDACLQLALRVRKAIVDLEAQTIVVASAMRNEGKTTVSCNLALALASLGQVSRVALVDLDLRRPSLARVLELPAPSCGIEEVIGSGRPLDQARVRIASPPLDIYPCLRGQAKAHELLLTPSFEATLRELVERYELVVLDTPPVLVVPDTTIIMEHADCYATVARAGITRARHFKRMLETLPRKRMLGAVLDGGATSIHKTYYRHYAPDDVGEVRGVEEAVDG